MIGLEFNGFSVGLLCLFGPVHPAISLADIVMDIRYIRPNLRGLAIIINRFFMPAEMLQGRTDIIQGIEMAGAKKKCTHEQRQGFLRAVENQERSAEIVQAVDKIRFQFQRLFEAGDSFFHFVLRL